MGLFVRTLPTSPIDATLRCSAASDEDDGQVLRYFFLIALTG
jgi:hypothetical protein